MKFGGLFRERNFYQSDAAKTAYRGLRKGFAKVGLDVVVKTFYSPIPDLEQLPPGTFERTSALPGTGWDLDRQLEFVRGLGPSFEEFRSVTNGGGDPWQYAPNMSYTEADAAMLYAMIRSTRPRRIVELGSGHSTLVTAQAARRNASEGDTPTLDVFDPFPSVVTDDLPGLTRLERIGAQEVPLSTFEALEAGDVLFVDTSHTVKTGGDVNRIVLDVLPRLASGVRVHFHDILLPYEVDRRWLLAGWYWNEQDLLQAFLAGNARWRVELAVHAAAKADPALARDFAPGHEDFHVPGAFWLRAS